MNNYIHKIDTWIALKGLSLNVGKRVFITFGHFRNSVSKEIQLKIKEHMLRRVKNTNFLGIVTGFNMTRLSHKEYVSNKTKYVSRYEKSQKL